MRIPNGALKDFLTSGQPCFKADLFTYTTAVGASFRWGTFDTPVSFGGHTWTSQGPLISRSALSVRNTVEVPQLTMRFLPRAWDTINGLPFNQQIMDGVLDGATVTLERAFMPIPGDTTLGLVLLFSGRHSKAEISAAGVNLTAKGDNVLMNQYAPKNVYQVPCLHEFCDAGCTLNAATFTINRQVAAGSTSNHINWSAVPGSPAIYSLGLLVFTTGANTGITRTVQFASSGGIDLVTPLENQVNTGDHFSITRGCDKTSTTCTALANLQHYRGFEFIPQAEIAV